MESLPTLSSMRDRFTAVLQGRKPDRMPFIDRLELWHKTHLRGNSLPPEFEGLSLTDIHRRVGMGQQRFVAPYSYRLRGADLTVRFRGDVIRREQDPLVEFFPRMAGLAVQTEVGLTDIALATPVGTVSVQYEMVVEMVRTGTEAYIRKHLIATEQDYRVAEYLLEAADIVPRFDVIAAEETGIGDIGLVVPMANRIPFQQILLEYLGEVATFYALADHPERVERLLQILHEKQMAAIEVLTALPGAYVEFGDNLHGPMTNPRLFRKYCLPHYQAYADALHSQGKKMGSHTDGDMTPLLHLLPESGLDVAESFAPEPLSRTTFEAAWAAWRNGPLIWGGIPSPILQEDLPEHEFRAWMERMFDTIGDCPILLGVGDQVLGNCLIERVRWIAEQVEARGPR